MSQEEYFELLDSPEKFEAYQAQREKALMQSLPDIMMKTLSEQTPFSMSSYAIMKACPEYRQYPSIVLQALQDTYSPDKDPITWEEDATALLRATSAQADKIAKGKGKVIDNRPNTPPLASAKSSTRTSRTERTGAPRNTDPTKQAFAEIVDMLSRESMDE